MATVKVKLRKSTIAGNPGTVYYLISHRRSRVRIPTAIRLFEGQWDAGSGRIEGAADDALLRRYDSRIAADLARLQRIVARLNAGGDAYEASDVAALFRRSGRQMRVMEFFDEQIARLLSHNRLATARNYQRTAGSFAAFLEGRLLSFAQIDEQLIADYEAWLLRRNVVRNTTSFYMRVLRALYNKAVERRMTVQTYPFSKVYTGVDCTRKRAVDEAVVLRLHRLDLSNSPALALARDLFLFSYCTRGMAFVDVAFLRKSDIAHGEISYLRHKTGQRLTIRIEPCIERILHRYRSMTAASPFVFPLITSDDPHKAFVQYRAALGSYNRRLKELARAAQIVVPLSSYTPRHTWATIARNRNIPLSVISAGMGHSSERTTQIYLASLDGSVIDRANAAILSPLNGEPVQR